MVNSNAEMVIVLYPDGHVTTIMIVATTATSRIVVLNSLFKYSTLLSIKLIYHPSPISSIYKPFPTQALFVLLVGHIGMKVG